jgi:hypothetical protein
VSRDRIEAFVHGSLPRMAAGTEEEPCELVFIPHGGDRPTAGMTLCLRGIGYVDVTLDAQALVQLARVAKRMLIDLATENIPS